jgi:uncharacterized protein YjiS (DUF1127 family)
LVHRANVALENFKAHRAQRRLYRQTFSELNALSSRELADLGINRTMVKSIAYEAAYGK